MFGQNAGFKLFGGSVATAIFAFIFVVLVNSVSAGGGGTPEAMSIMGGVPVLWLIAPAASLVGLYFAWNFYTRFMQVDEGTDMMKNIAGHVRDGANTYLRRQYSVVTVVFIVLFVVFLVLAFLGVQNWFTPPAFIAGGFFSGLCGWLGMKSATQASARTANKARESLDGALKVAFRSGSVMGLTVVGFGLINVAVWYFAMLLIYNFGWFGTDPDMELQEMLREITSTMLTFGIGASTMALFARVGGGIYTKAADVGADLVGKVEAGIPEDDPRNPATIADNVGDNVGDVAGMGADLYESYVGSILATSALGAAIPAAASAGVMSIEIAVTAPMIVAGLGIILSVLGVFMVRCKEDASQKNLLRALLFGTFSSTVLVLAAVAAFAAFGLFSWGVFGAILSGLVAGVVIGQSTEWFTADEFRWTKGVAEQAEMGTAPLIIEGIAVGMLSSAIPVITIVAAILAAFGLAGGFTDISLGLYGVAFAAVGMLSTLGITLATDAYGPVADNAGGNAEMSGLPPEVRERTDALDSLGNTTAATGKGFAIGSAALTAMALLAAYVSQLPTLIRSAAEDGFYRIGNVVFYTARELPEEIPAAYRELDLVAVGAGIAEYVEALRLNLLNPMLLGGLFLGAMMTFLFCGLTMRAVGRAAGEMVAETRRQFKKLRGKLIADGMSEEQAADPDNWPASVESEGEELPNYASCVAIATSGAQKEMVVPSLLAIIVPVLVGLVLGIAGVVGLLAGALVAGLSLACLLNNGGGSWDNAKKWIEKDNMGGKGSEAHKASVVGDTVGDPFKDTSGPSLNILIKLMAMSSVAFAGLVVNYAPEVQEMLGLGGF